MLQFKRKFRLLIQDDMYRVQTTLASSCSLTPVRGLERRIVGQGEFGFGT